MPTYEYRCPGGHEFEKFQPMSQGRRRSRCPVCGRMAVRHISGGAGLVFKGSGFYATDYKKVEKAEKGEKAETGEKGEKGERGEKGEKGEKGIKRATDPGKKDSA